MKHRTIKCYTPVRVLTVCSQFTALLHVLDEYNISATTITR